MTHTQFFKELNNWFERDAVKGTFTISGGLLIEDIGLLDGQFYKIEDSILNDGVHKHPADSLKDETFDGTIVKMAVPIDVIELETEISDWIDKYGDVMNAPYTSESFGGYSYSKGGGNAITGTGGADADAWKSAFAGRLTVWRKL